MKLQLLYVDELRGFYKSKVMLFLWIGLPIVALLFRFVQVSTTGQAIPFHSYLCLGSFKPRRNPGCSDAYGLHNQREEQACLRVVPDKTAKKKRHNALQIPLRLHLCCDCKSDSYLCGRCRRLLYLGCTLSHSLQRHSSILSHKPLDGCGGLLSRRSNRRCRPLCACRSHTGHLWRKPNIRHPPGSHIAKPASSRIIHRWISGGSLSCSSYGSHCLI